MGFFTKLERMSEKYIEGFFKTKFPDHIQPAEIAKLLRREMRDKKTVGLSKVYIPNEYIVYLSKEDWDAIDPVSPALTSEIVEFLKKKAREKNYVFAGDLKVSFLVNENLSLGEITVNSSYSQMPTEAAPQEKPSEYTMVADRTRFYRNGSDSAAQDTITGRAAVAVLPKAVLVQKLGGKDGTRFPLSSRSSVVGRKKTNDICLNDSNVSRIHASVDLSDKEYYITDLGSTNGTFVNGARISKKKLVEGDLIRMGTTILEFRVV